MKDLDPWALELEGTRLIEASAGTGKTYTLTTLYLRLLVEHDLMPSEILVVTYTHAATAELRDRIRARIREAIAIGGAEEDVGSVPNAEPELTRLANRSRELGTQIGRRDPLRRALQEFDEAAIFTIHGFCQRTLQEYAYESGMSFDAELVEESETLERRVAHDLWSRLLAEEDPNFVEWLRYGAGSRWKFEPEELRRSILGELGADEEMPVLPAIESLDAAGDLEGLRMEAEQVWLRWAESWQASRGTVAALLLGENDLKRTSYKIETIETKWFPLMDRWAEIIAKSQDAKGMNATELPSWWKNVVPEGLVSGLKKGGKTVEDPFFVQCGALKDSLDALDGARRNRALLLRLIFVREARVEARKRRDEQHILFFDDLLCELRGALRSKQGDRLAQLLRSRCRFALIDEFQDTDPVQYEIFRRVWHETAGSDKDREGGLFLIGDPKQAIYSFRGADVYTYLSARDDAKAALHGLGINWRSSAGLIAAVNTLFSQPKEPFGLAAIEFNEVASRPGLVETFKVSNRSSAGLRVLMADRKEAMEAGVVEESVEKGFPQRFGRTTLMRVLASDVADLLDSGGTIDGRPIEPSDIAILCRRKIELAAARRALEGLGIPCVDRGDSDVFDSREAWEMLSVLRAWLRSSDPGLLRGALSTAAHAFDAEAIRNLGDDSPELSAVAERFGELAGIWSQSGFGLAFESWRRTESVTERLLAYQDGERRLTNWLQLAELLQRREHDHGGSRIGLVAWLERMVAASGTRSEVGSEASLLRLERDDQAVSLVTLHRSKGLEYEIVYLPSLWEEASARGPSTESAKDAARSKPPIRFHDATTGRRSLDLGGPDYAAHVEVGREEAASEQLRLLYVGLTRAKQQCVVLWGAIGSAFAKAPIAQLLDARRMASQGEDRAASAATRRKWKDEQWVTAWRAVADEAEQTAPNAIAIEPVRYVRRDRWHASRVESSPLEFQAPRRRLDRPFVTTSFSALVRNAQQPDRPSQPSPSTRMPELLGGPGVTGRDRQDGSAEEILREIPGLSNLAAAMNEFPRGAEAGTLLHDVLENVEFSTCGTSDPSGIEELRSLATQAIHDSRFGSSPNEKARLIDQVVHVALSVARTRLRPELDSFCLADLPPGQQRAEIEFTLVAPGGESSTGFSPSTLSSLLRSAGGDEESPLVRYASRLSEMGWRELRGYLRGFIDSVFHDGERYFLIDYKSNHLGSLQEDYAPECLIQPMIDHDYVLQYLIYSIALDRHLVQSISDYNYDKHFGGVYYLFLRGLAETHEPGCGVFFDRPSAEVIRGASALLGRGSRMLA
jgi:exodeoxyribonuclease V beta subunit